MLTETKKGIFGTVQQSWGGGGGGEKQSNPLPVVSCLAHLEIFIKICSPDFQWYIEKNIQNQNQMVIQGCKSKIP